MSSAFTATNGAEYEQLMGRWSLRLAEPFLDFCGTADRERVLDVGAGTGNLSLAVTNRCKPTSVLGVDYAQTYIDFARTKTVNPAIRFQVADACRLPLENHSFDRVLSMLMLHHVPEAGKAIAEMRRVARSGAVIGACVWDSQGGLTAHRMFYDTAAMIDDEAKLRRNRFMTRPMTRPGELLAGFKAAGLADCEERALTIRMDFASFDDYWAPFLGGQGPVADYMAGLSQQMRQSLQSAVRDAYLVGEADGPRSYTAMAWAVKGVTPG